VLLSDLNGESYKAKEWVAAEIRALEFSPLAHLHPADCFGDVGCVAGVAQLALAAIGFTRGEWLAPALVVAGSDGASRAVVVADAVDGSGHLEPDLETPPTAGEARSHAGAMSEALVGDHLEEAGFLRLQRRLSEARVAEAWSLRDGLDRRHAWHLLALASLASDAPIALAAAAGDRERPVEDRAAAVAALALASSDAVATASESMLAEDGDETAAALAEALGDLPDSAVEALARRLNGQASPRLQEVLASLPAVEIDAARIGESLTGEPAAWAAARAARRDAHEVAARLPEDQVTPRLLFALGGAGYAGALDLLLRFVADPDPDRANAAGSALAALTGIDVLEPADPEETGSETWSRSPDRWRDAIEQARIRPREPERLLRGKRWTLERAERELGDPATLNGVRRSLATRSRPRLTAYYWLQKRIPAGYRQRQGEFELERFSLEGGGGPHADVGHDQWLAVGLQLAKLDPDDILRLIAGERSQEGGQFLANHARRLGWLARGQLFHELAAELGQPPGGELVGEGGLQGQAARGEAERRQDHR
jgi:hypothetical protein